MFLELEEELAQALLNKDSEPLHRILDEDYILTNHLGRLKTKQQEIERFQHSLEEQSFFSVTNGELRVHLYDEAAVVTGTQIRHATKNDQLLYTKMRFTSMYAKRNGNWKLVAGHRAETETQQR